MIVFKILFGFVGAVMLAMVPFVLLVMLGLFVIGQQLERSKENDNNKD